MYRSSPLRSTFNTNVITGLSMCKVCTEAVHCEALWTRTLSQVWACVKYAPKQSMSKNVQKTCPKAKTRPCQKGTNPRKGCVLGSANVPVCGHIYSLYLIFKRYIRYTYIIKVLEWSKAIYSIGSLAADGHWCQKMPPNHFGAVASECAVIQTCSVFKENVLMSFGCRTSFHLAAYLRPPGRKRCSHADRMGVSDDTLKTAWHPSQSNASRCIINVKSTTSCRGVEPVPWTCASWAFAGSPLFSTFSKSPSMWIIWIV